MEKGKEREDYGWLIIFNYSYNWDYFYNNIALK